MFRFKIRAALVALTALAALALPASALATNVTTWQIAQQNDPAAANTDQAPYANVLTQIVSPPLAGDLPYGAERNPEDFSLIYGNQTFGVNLTWAPSSGLSSGSSDEYQWEFIRPPGTYATQQIAASESVALYDTTNHQYLARACPSGTGCIGAPVEAFGINLYWSTTPSYEWQVFKGGNPSTPSYADLYDSAEEAYMIPWASFEGVGPELGWIHAPFETGPDYIPPKPPVSTSQQGNEAPPTTIKG
jgi:hypothetical protein